MPRRNDQRLGAELARDPRFATNPLRVQNRDVLVPLVEKTSSSWECTLMGQHVDITEAGIRLRPWLLRYSTVPQLDAMATAAGFALEHRWADWAGAPFEADGSAHVSVYRLPDPAIA